MVACKLQLGYSNPDYAIELDCVAKSIKIEFFLGLIIDFNYRSKQSVGLRKNLLRQWEHGPIFTSFSLNRFTIRLNRCKNHSRFPICLTTIP